MIINIPLLSRCYIFARKLNSTNIQIGALRELKHLIDEGILTEESFRR